MVRKLWCRVRKLFRTWRKPGNPAPLEGCSLLFGVWLDGHTPSLILETPSGRFTVKLTRFGTVNHYETRN